MNAKVSVITNVDLDHTELLGDSTAAIATEKAGIIKQGSTAVIGETDPEIATIFEDTAAAVSARVVRRGRDFDFEPGTSDPGFLTISTGRRTYDDLRVPFYGRHQLANAACALVAAEEFLDGDLTRDVVARAWTAVANPGRFEVVAGIPDVVIDVAHNPHGTRALMESLEERFGDRPRVVVFGVNPHKDAETMLTLLRPHARALITTSAPAAPSIPGDQLAKSADRLGWPRVISAVDPNAAIGKAYEVAKPGEVIVCTGSHYWIGEVRQRILAR
jgi:dihydrofolate synthase / folylpolyglutamate synthase